MTAEITSLAELKVVEYVLKHTWGYHEYGLTKHITTNEFMHGRQRKDGSRMDRGTGLSKPSVIDGLKKAVIHGFLVESVDASDRARIRKSYALRMLTDRGGDSESNPPLSTDTEPDRADVKNLDTGVKNVDTRGKETSPRSEKDTLERHFIKPLTGDKSIFKQLPSLRQSRTKTAYVANYLLETLGDSKSKHFYKLLAGKVPEPVIYTALAEVRADGAEHPAKLFTYKMKRYALNQLKQAGLNQ